MSVQCPASSAVPRTPHVPRAERTCLETEYHRSRAPIEIICDTEPTALDCCPLGSYLVPRKSPPTDFPPPPIKSLQEDRPRKTSLSQLAASPLSSRTFSRAGASPATRRPSCIIKRERLNPAILRFGCYVTREFMGAGGLHVEDSNGTFTRETFALIWFPKSFNVD